MLYGRGITNEHLAVPTKEFMKVFRAAGSTTIINLELSGKKHPVLVHDVQKNYITDEITHIDFYQIQQGQKIKAHVPVEFVGEAPAVKTHGGVLNKGMTEIEMEALPEDMPHQIEVNLESLQELGQSLHIKDLKISSKVHITVDPETVIVSVSEPRAEEEAPAVVDVTAVEVEGDQKKQEREAKKSEEGAAA